MCRHLQPRATHGFTLVELLVVVTIIVVLLALLVPATEKALEAAQRAVCASNLHHWGVAHGLYYMDNKRQLMIPTRIWDNAATGAGGLYPPHAWVWNEAEHPGEFSAQAYAPYNAALSYSSIPTSGSSTGTPAGPVSTQGAGTGASASKMFLCPSDVRYQSRIEHNNNQAQKPPGRSAAAPGMADPGGPIVESHYAYFARVGLWRAYPNDPNRIRAPWPEELVDRSLGGGKLLMNDHVYYNNSWQINSFSHGDPQLNSPLTLQGVNQLYGDGGVGWYGSEYFDLKAMASFTFDTAPGANEDVPHYINSFGDYNGVQPYHFYATNRAAP